MNSKPGKQAGKHISIDEMNELVRNAASVKRKGVASQIISAHEQIKLYDRNNKFIGIITEYMDGERIYFDADCFDAEAMG